MSTKNIFIVDAESDKWGEKVLAEKKLKTAEKLAVTSTDEKLRTYLVVKQGAGNMRKIILEMKQEYGFSSSSEIQCAEATNSAKLLQNCQPMNKGEGKIDSSHKRM